MGRHEEDSSFYAWVCDMTGREKADVYPRWTYGKEGKWPLVYKSISSLDTDHLKAIIDTHESFSGKTFDLIREEYAKRTKQPVIEKKAPKIERCSRNWCTIKKDSTDVEVQYVDDTEDQCMNKIIKKMVEAFIDHKEQQWKIVTPFWEITFKVEEEELGDGEIDDEEWYYSL